MLVISIRILIDLARNFVNLIRILDHSFSIRILVNSTKHFFLCRFREITHVIFTSLPFYSVEQCNSVLQLEYYIRFSVTLCRLCTLLENIPLFNPIIIYDYRMSRTFSAYVIFVFIPSP